MKGILLPSTVRGLCGVRHRIPPRCGGKGVEPWGAREHKAMEGGNARNHMRRLVRSDEGDFGQTRRTPHPR
jgi:hypothetical protein